MARGIVRLLRDHLGGSDVPIDRRPRGKGPERIELFDADPAIGVGLTIDLYGTKLEVSSKIEIESIENLDDEFKIALRVSGLDVKAPAGSPAAMMIQSMDFTRPGNLMKMMPQMNQMMDGCIQMMKSHMSQPTGPSPKPDVEKKG